MKLHSLTRFGAFLGIFSLLTSVVLAQQDDEQEEQEAPVAQQPLPVEEVVVTGSRIRRDTFTSASPITVITSETSALAGLLDTADILQNSTVATGQQIDDTFSGFVTDGGPGSRSVALRGLGEQRTLVLVNGKRWGPSGVRGAVNSVDLTAIPSSSIARYEILKDGASSIYG
ncbi:MAG: TonB-dependent receptor plug domain-containing protein, partial [Proteobacteria bacterium]|nr:TonB-dependent receptor plug domain-containing protein [Pseudomonadota bacterium]